MHNIFRALAVLMLVGSPIMSVAAQPASAPSLSQSDRTAIEARIAAFDTMMREGRIGESLDFLPLRLLRMIADKIGMPLAKVRTMIAGQMAKAVEGVTFLSFGMDMQAAIFAVTPDGQRNYMLIPTQSVIALPGAEEGENKVVSKTQTLAIKDDGQWYLVRIDNAQQISLLRAAYPEFAGVSFPFGSSSVE